MVIGPSARGLPERSKSRLSVRQLFRVDFGPESGAQADAERLDLFRGASRGVGPFIDKRSPVLLRRVGVTRDDVNVVMRRVVEYEGVDVLGTLTLKCASQPSDQPRFRAGLPVGEFSKPTHVASR